MTAFKAIRRSVVAYCLSLAAPATKIAAARVRTGLELGTTRRSLGRSAMRPSVLVLLVVGACFGPLSSPALASGGWSVPKTVDEGHDLTAVSCVSENFCVAADHNGDAVTYRNHKWGATEKVAEFGPLYGVSCGSESFCVAVDSVQRFTYNGTVWSGPVSLEGVGGGFDSVSCVSTNFCMIGGIWTTVTYKAGTWHAPVLIAEESAGQEFQSVSCASENFCAAVGGPWGETYDGETDEWSGASVVDGESGLHAMSCAPKSSSCVGVSTQWNTVTYGGGKWNPAEPPNINEFYGLFSVSCASATFCTAADDVNGGSAIMFNGSTWSAPETIDSQGADTYVSCPSEMFCLAVDKDGHAMTYEAGAKGEEGAATKKHQEEEAAAKKHQEEEAAAKKHQEEEAAAKKHQEEVGASVKIQKVRVARNHLVVTIETSEPGAVTISGRGLKKTTESLPAGTHQITIAFTKAGKAEREKHTKIKLFASLKVDGTTTSGSKEIKL
jgi:hypothetical protein